MTKPFVYFVASLVKLSALSALVVKQVESQKTEVRSEGQKAKSQEP